MKLPENTISEITMELDMGMICYVHKETKEVKVVFDLDRVPDIEDFMEEEINAIEAERDKYVRLIPMASRESFNIMKDFAHEVQDSEIKDKLLDVLNQRRPFRRFGDEVANHGDLRDQWFKYKDERYKAWVRECLEWE